MSPAEVVSYACPDCGFQLWHAVEELSASVLGLFDDARFPGRCILALKDHEERYELLSADTFDEFNRDVRRAAIAIANLTGADRVNVAVLGNEVPHVHAHLVPRIRVGDPSPLSTPWEHPLPERKLAEADRVQLIDGLRRQLLSEVMQ